MIHSTKRQQEKTKPLFLTQLKKNTFVTTNMDFLFRRIEISDLIETDVFISASIAAFEEDAYPGYQPEMKKRVNKNFNKFVYKF